MASEYVIICLDSIKHSDERKEVVTALEEDGKEIIDISIDQMEQFAGNMLQIRSRLGLPYMVMSHAALASLSGQQIEKISAYNKIIPIAIPTIELYGGGSVRCMIMEVFPPDLN